VAATATQKVEEVTQQVTATEKSTAKEQYKDARTNYRQSITQSQQALSNVVKGLRDAGVSSYGIGKLVKTANRQANKIIGIEMKQAYNDYRSKEISREEFTNTLYGSAAKKLDSIVSALRDALAQKVAPEDKSTEAVKERANETKSDNATKATDETRVTDADEASNANAKKSAKAAKENANATKSDKANKETRVTDANEASKANAGKNAEKTKEKANETAEKIPPGLEKKEEVKTENGNIVKAEKKGPGAGPGGPGGPKGPGGPGNGIFGPGGPGKEFGELVSLFNNIDKMINGFADKAEGKGNDKDKGDSLINFASRLNDMFSGINKAFGSHSGDNVGNRLGVAQVDKEKIGQLFDNGHGSGAINRIGDAGEGTGNFNATSFMSSISSGINDALESYKEVQKAEKEAKEEAAQEEAVVALA
jgi:hypothetical protein